MQYKNRNQDFSIGLLVVAWKLKSLFIRDKPYTHYTVFLKLKLIQQTRTYYSLYHIFYI